MQFLIISSIYIAESVMTLWFATMLIAKTGHFRTAMPLIFATIVLCMGATLFFYDFLLTYWHIAFTLLYVISLTTLIFVHIRFILRNNIDSI